MGGCLDHKVSQVPEASRGPPGSRLTVFPVLRERMACLVVLGRREDRVRCWGPLLEPQVCQDALEN